MINPLPDNVMESLRALDTCMAANAIEQFDIQLRNEGFVNSASLQCHFPKLPPTLGYAVTMRVRSGNPPMEGGAYLDRTDWWSALESLPVPHVVVIQDLDRRPGIGAFVGEVHAAIFQAMGCVAVVTNGAVRDLPAVEQRGFQFFSGTVSPSHAYVHVVDVGAVVEIAGMRIQAGDLLLGDQHGLLRIPQEIASHLPEVAARLRERENKIFQFCKSPNFSRNGLLELLKDARI